MPLHRWSPLTLALVAGLAAAAPAPAPAPAPEDARGVFAEGGSTTTLPFRLVNERIYVQALVDGRALTLLLDPGGVNLLTPQAAAALGLGASGGDAAHPAAGTARAGRLELGAYAIDGPLFHVADLKRLPEVEGVAFDGLVGFESLQHVVLTIDYAERRLTLTAPGAFVAPAAAVRLPFVLEERMPLVEGEVDGMKGRFRLDPGARCSVRLHAPFVKAHGLLERYPRRHSVTTSWGIGGPGKAYATRAGWLKLGAAEVAAPVLELGADALGDASDRYVAGDVGGGALKRFTVTFDYPGQAAYLVPNREHGAPDLFDRSGMWINLDGDDLIVDDLMANGPAARAQVQKHDRIVSVDGTSASGLALPELRAMLRVLPKGTRVKMTLRRDSKVVYATIVLDDLVPPP